MPNCHSLSGSSQNGESFSKSSIEKWTHEFGFAEK